MKAYPRTKAEALREISQRIAADPGRWLLRLPFSLLPARWVLSDRAMRILSAAAAVGINDIDRNASDG